MDGTNSDLKLANLSNEFNLIASKIDELRGEAIQLTQNLVKIKSISPDEEQVQEYIDSVLREIGFDVKKHSKTPGRPNLIASLRGKHQHPEVLFVAHVDNIPAGDSSSWTAPPYEARIIDDRILGRGVADMKAGLASMIIAAKAIKNSGLEMKGTFSIATVIDHETGGSTLGMRYLAENSLLSADAAVFGEPTFPCMAIALKGGAQLKITTRGKSVGTGWPENGVNAITNMAKLLLRLESVEFERLHPLLGKTTLVPGTTIKGGTNVNSVPNSCEATIDVHYIPGETINNILAKIQHVIDDLSQQDSNFKADLELLQDEDPFEITQDQKLVIELQSCIQSVFGSKAELIGVPSSGDVRFLGKLGIPAIPAYGPGEIGKGHVINESVKIDALIGVAKVYALLALKLWHT